MAVVPKRNGTHLAKKGMGLIGFSTTNELLHSLAPKLLTSPSPLPGNTFGVTAHRTHTCLLLRGIALGS
jgi:hypothetical protein